MPRPRCNTRAAADAHATAAEMYCEALEPGADADQAQDATDASADAATQTDTAAEATAATA